MPTLDPALDSLSDEVLCFGPACGSRAEWRIFRQSGSNDVHDEYVGWLTDAFKHLDGKADAVVNS